MDFTYANGEIDEMKRLNKGLWGWMQGIDILAKKMSTRQYHMIKF